MKTAKRLRPLSITVVDAPENPEAFAMAYVILRRWLDRVDAIEGGSEVKQGIPIPKDSELS